MDDLRSMIRAVLLAGGAASALPGANALSADADEATLAETTGSRLPSPDPRSKAVPLTVITRQDIDRSGANTLGALLQEQPWSGPALNTKFNNGGDGTTRFEMRGSGTQRMVILLDGRRWIRIPGGKGAVDLDGIPLAIVERVEVLREDASAVYGVDAVAGVINVVTVRGLDGARARAHIGRYREGDGEELAADFMLGSVGPRAEALFAATYYRAEPVGAGDRNISSEPLFRTGNAFGSSATPMGRFRIPDAGGTLGPAYAVFGGTGATRDFGGDATPTVGDFRAFDPSSDLYNHAPENYLSTPVERWALLAKGRYEIADGLRFVTDALYEHRLSAQQLASIPLALPFDGAFTIHATNPYNFFNLSLVPFASSGNLTDGVLSLRDVRRRFVENGPRRFEQDVTTVRVGVGFEGEFQVGTREFGWTAGYDYTDTNQIGTISNLLSAQRLAMALGPVSNCIAPCVPLNLFGGVGSITQAMLDFVRCSSHEVAGTVSEEYHARLHSLDLLELPAGPLGVSLGIESRREKSLDDPDAFIASAGVVGHNPGQLRAPTRGGVTFDDLALELAVPLLADQPFAQRLDLDVALRWTDHQAFGSTTNSKFSLSWRPFDDLVLRGSWQEGARAPTIFELFGDASFIYPTLLDPCAFGSTFMTGVALPYLDPTPDTQAEAQLLANCTGVTVTGAFNAVPSPNIPAAVQVPWPWYQTNTQFSATVGGNPNLMPETVSSTTFGLVYTPGFVEGLSVALDLHSMEVDEVITQLSPMGVLNGCYVGEDPDLCALFTRESAGEIADLYSGFGNADAFTMESIDLTVDYRLGEVSWLPGEWGVRWETAYLARMEFCALQNSGLLGCKDYAQTNTGDAALPMFRSNLTLDWAYGEWDAAWRMRFIGRHYEACSAPTLTSVASSKFWGGTPPAGWTYCSNPTDSTNALGATTYHSVQVSYTVAEWDTRLSFGVENLFDKKPPVSTQVFVNSFDPTTYEVPGKFVYLRVEKTF